MAQSFKILFRFFLHLLSCLIFTETPGARMKKRTVFAPNMTVFATNAINSSCIVPKFYRVFPSMTVLVPSTTIFAQNMTVFGKL